ncbi:hypothetical protein [Spiroplasma endosymbiont of Agriotes lineatus]
MLEKFERNVPTTAKYPFLKQVDGISNLHQKNKNIKQPKRDQA